MSRSLPHTGILQSQHHRFSTKASSLVPLGPIAGLASPSCVSVRPGPIPSERNGVGTQSRQAGRPGQVGSGFQQWGKMGSATV